jgi:hypothetical protein
MMTMKDRFVHQKVSTILKVYIMKNQTIRLCVVLAFIAGLSSCKKEEQALQTMETGQPSAKVENFVHTRVTNTGGQYFKAIDTICPPYLAFTSLIDFKKYEDGENSLVSDGNLSVGYVGKYPLYIIRRVTYGWWSNWNKPPFVENDNPIVWAADLNPPGVINLSKNCYVFGFELSATVGEFGLGPLSYTVKYEDTVQHKVIGYISNDVVAPNGARLFAVKSDIPFNKIEIFVQRKPKLCAR